MKTKVRNENLVITKNQFKTLFLKIGLLPIHQTGSMKNIQSISFKLPYKKKINKIKLFKNHRQDCEHPRIAKIDVYTTTSNFFTLKVTAAQLHSTKPEIRFCTGSNPARSMLEIHDGEDLWQWSQLEIRVNAFCWSTIPQKKKNSKKKLTKCLFSLFFVVPRKVLWRPQRPW